jgi:hypothetical protein
MSTRLPAELLYEVFSYVDFVVLSTLCQSAACLLPYVAQILQGRERDLFALFGITSIRGELFRILHDGAGALIGSGTLWLTEHPSSRDWTPNNLNLVLTRAHFTRIDELLRSNGFIRWPSALLRSPHVESVSTSGKTAFFKTGDTFRWDVTVYNRVPGVVLWRYITVTCVAVHSHVLICMLLSEHSLAAIAYTGHTFIIPYPAHLARRVAVARSGASGTSLAAAFYTRTRRKLEARSFSLVSSINNMARRACGKLCPSILRPLRGATGFAIVTFAFDSNVAGYGRDLMADAAANRFMAAEYSFYFSLAHCWNIHCMLFGQDNKLHANPPFPLLRVYANPKRERMARIEWAILNSAPVSVYSRAYRHAHSLPGLSSHGSRCVARHIIQTATAGSRPVISLLALIPNARRSFGVRLLARQGTNVSCCQRR